VQPSTNDIDELLGLAMPTPLRPRSALRNYQNWTIQKIKDLWSSDPDMRKPGLILAFDMGSGKTGAVLTAVRDLLDDFTIRKVLVVAPKLVAMTTWPDEIEDWEHTKALTWTLLRVEDDHPEVTAAEKHAHQSARFLGATPNEARQEAGAAGTAEKERIRGRLALEDTEIHLINKEGLNWLWTFFGEGKRWPYDLIVIDEASMLKNGKKRSKGRADAEKKGGELSRFGVLAKARKCSQRVVELTGTPAPKGLHNLWGLAYIVDLGRRLGTARTDFEDRWFSINKYSHEIKPHPHSEAAILGKLKDIMFSLDPKDYAELPPVVPNEIRVHLPAKALAEYNKFRKTLVSDLYDVEAVNSGVLTGKLLQFANGSMYQEDGNDVPIHDEKLDALESIIEEANGAPVFVAYGFKFDLRRIKRKYPKAVVVNDTNPRDTKRRWNNGEIPILLAHPASAGHGLNFQYGGNISVWYGLTHDLELYQQFNKRLHRPGQLNTVFNHHIIAACTIDETLLPILAIREANQNSIFAATKAVIRAA
jgi:hypothetical protein